MSTPGWPWAAATVLVAVLGLAAPAAAGVEPSPTPGAEPTSQDHSHEHGHEPAAPASPTAPGGHDDHEAPGGHDDHEAPPPDGVPTTTKVVVLGGFGLVNAAVLGAAVLLRRRDRRRPRGRR